MTWIITYHAPGSMLHGQYLSRYRDRSMGLTSDLNKALRYGSQNDAIVALRAEPWWDEFAERTLLKEYKVTELKEKKQQRKKQDEKQKFCIVRYFGNTHGFGDSYGGIANIESNNEYFVSVLKNDPNVCVFDDYDISVRCLFDLQRARFSGGLREDNEDNVKFELRFYPPPEEESEGGGEGENEDESESEGEEDQDSEGEEQDGEGEDSEDEDGQDGGSGGDLDETKFGKIISEQGSWGIREYNKSNRKISSLLDVQFDSQKAATEYLIKNNFHSDEWFDYEPEKIK